MRPSANRHVLAILRKALAPREGAPPMEQWRFAGKVGCSKETIRKIEKGQIRLSDDLAYKIAVATGVDAEWLLANDLTTWPENEFGRPYTRRDLEQAQAFNTWNPPSNMLAVSSITYSARLRSICSAAAKTGVGTYRLAMYKLHIALRECEEEFGEDAELYLAKSADAKRAIEVVRRDLDEASAIFLRPVAVESSVAEHNPDLYSAAKSIQQPKKKLSKQSKRRKLTR